MLEYIPKLCLYEYWYLDNILTININISLQMQDKSKIWFSKKAFISIFLNIVDKQFCRYGFFHYIEHLYCGKDYFCSQI